MQAPTGVPVLGWTVLSGFEPVQREQLEGLLTSMWERSGGYEAWSQVAADDADDTAA